MGNSSGVSTEILEKSNDEEISSYEELSMSVEDGMVINVNESDIDDCSLRLPEK